MTRKVRIYDRDAKTLLYDRLLADDSNLMRFESGAGFVARDEAKRNGWIICSGWHDDEDAGPEPEVCDRCQGTGELPPEYRAHGVSWYAHDAPAHLWRTCPDCSGSGVQAA